MEYRVFDQLPPDAVAIRQTVFVEEQGFCEEFTDDDIRALHIVAYDGERAVGTCRFFTGETAGTYLLGRLAVLRDMRGRQVGAGLLHAAEEQIRAISGNRVLLHAQERAAGFYEKQGYAVCGDHDFDEGCPHVWMDKPLTNRQEASNIVALTE